MHYYQEFQPNWPLNKTKTATLQMENIWPDLCPRHFPKKNVSLGLTPTWSPSQEIFHSLLRLSFKEKKLLQAGDIKEKKNIQRIVVKMPEMSICLCSWFSQFAATS